MQLEPRAPAQRRGSQVARSRASSPHELGAVPPIGVRVTNRESRQEDLMSKKLHVGNLGFDVTSQELQDVFTSIGPCDSATVLMDRTTGQSRGFGFVEMTS